MVTFLKNVTKRAFLKVKDFTFDFAVGFVEEITFNITSGVPNPDAVFQVPRGGAIAKATTAVLGSRAVVKTIFEATPNLWV